MRRALDRCVSPRRVHSIVTVYHRETGLEVGVLLPENSEAQRAVAAAAVDTVTTTVRAGRASETLYVYAESDPSSAKRDSFASTPPLASSTAYVGELRG